MLIDTAHFDSIELDPCCNKQTAHPPFGYREKIANSEKSQISSLFIVSRKENKKPNLTKLEQRFWGFWVLLFSSLFRFSHTFPATKQNGKNKQIRKSEKSKREMYLLLFGNLLPKLAGLFSQSIHCCSGVFGLAPKPEGMRPDSNNKDWNEYFWVTETLDLTASCDLTLLC